MGDQMRISLDGRLGGSVQAQALSSAMSGVKTEVCAAAF